MSRRHAWIGAIVPLLLRLALRCAWADVSPETLYRDTLPSVFTLSVDTAKGASQGTGFAAEAPDILVTAWHVVKDAQRVSAKAASGEVYECVGVIDKDEIHDVALVRIKAHNLPMLQMQGAPPEVGSRVYALGAPRGLDFSLVDGLVSQLRTFEGTNLIQITCPVEGGSSGSPLLNRQGEVIGVVIGRLPETQGLNFAVMAKYVLALDASRAVEEWAGSAASHAADAQDGETALPASLDALLAETLVTYTDLLTAVAQTLATHNTTKRSVSPSAALLTLTRDLSIQTARLSEMRGANEVRERARVTMLDVCTPYRRFIDIVTENLTLLRNGQNLPPQSDQEARQLVAEWKRASKRFGLVLAMTGSPEFWNTLPPQLQAILNPSTAQRAVDLEVEVWMRNPTYVVMAPPKTLGYRLGLRLGDELMAVNDKPVASLAELETQLYDYRGQVVRIAVKRNDRYTALRTRLPKF